MKIIAAIKHPPMIAKILTHLGLPARAPPQSHETVAVVGIGGLGHLAVQYTKAAGFKTVAITHSPDKETLAKRGLSSKERAWQRLC